MNREQRNEVLRVVCGEDAFPRKKPKPSRRRVVWKTVGRGGMSFDSACGRVAIWSNFCGPAYAVGIRDTEGRRIAFCDRLTPQDVLLRVRRWTNAVLPSGTPHDANRYAAIRAALGLKRKPK